MQLIATVALVYLLTSLLGGPLAAQYRAAAWMYLGARKGQERVRRAVGPAEAVACVESAPIASDVSDLHVRIERGAGRRAVLCVLLALASFVLLAVGSRADRSGRRGRRVPLHAPAAAGRL